MRRVAALAVAVLAAGSPIAVASPHSPGGCAGPFLAKSPGELASNFDETGLWPVLTLFPDELWFDPFEVSNPDQRRTSSTSPSARRSGSGGTEQIPNRPSGWVVEICAGLRRQTHMINDERDLIS